MAVTDQSGSGRFVPAQEWTCSQHDYPLSHMCDCSHCDREWDCDECATAEWEPLLNADGSPQMRELGHFEISIDLLPALLASGQRGAAKIEWLEDQMLPKTKT